MAMIKLVTLLLFGIVASTTTYSQGTGACGAFCKNPDGSKTQCEPEERPRWDSPDENCYCDYHEVCEPAGMEDDYETENQDETGNLKSDSNESAALEPQSGKDDSD